MEGGVSMRRLILAALAACVLLWSHACAEQTVTLTFAGDVTLGSEENIRRHEGSFDSLPTGKATVISSRRSGISSRRMI